MTIHFRLDESFLFITIPSCEFISGAKKKSNFEDLTSLIILLFPKMTASVDNFFFCF